MPRLDAEQQQALAARVRYYRDIGVYDFYRRGEATAEPEISLEPAAQATHATAVAVTTPEEAMPGKQPSTPAPSLLPPDTVVAPGQRVAALQAIREEIGDCKRCPLAFTGRHTIVFGEG